MAKPGVMTKFRIDELSGVDEPAQKGARALIMKRDPDAKATIRAKGDSGTTPTLGKTAGDGEDQGDDSMSTAAIKKALGLKDDASDAEVEAAVTKAAGDASKLAKAEEEKAEAIAKAAMTATAREHYELLVKADPPKAKEFMGLDPKAQDAACKKYAEGDETCVVEGRTISKRAVGEDVFAILKGQSERIEKNEKALAKAQEATATAHFAKRASDEFAHLAGTEDERAALLKFLDGAPDEVKKTAETVLKAAEGASKAAFSKAGHRDDKDNFVKGAGNDLSKADAEAQLKKMADDLVKADPKLSFAKAYTDVLDTAAGAALYEKTLSAPVEE